MYIPIVGCAFSRNDFIKQLQGIYKASKFGPVMAKEREVDRNQLEFSRKRNRYWTAEFKNFEIHVLSILKQVKKICASERTSENCINKWEIMRKVL